MYERPFLKDREDFSIAYYGIVGTNSLTGETPALKELMAESYYMSNEEGKLDDLKPENKIEKDNSLFSWFL